MSTIISKIQGTMLAYQIGAARREAIEANQRVADASLYGLGDDLTTAEQYEVEAFDRFLGMVPLESQKREYRKLATAGRGGKHE